MYHKDCLLGKENSLLIIFSEIICSATLRRHAWIGKRKQILDLELFFIIHGQLHWTLELSLIKNLLPFLFGPWCNLSFKILDIPSFIFHTAKLGGWQTTGHVGDVGMIWHFLLVSWKIKWSHLIMTFPPPTWDPYIADSDVSKDAES